MFKYIYLLILNINMNLRKDFNWRLYLQNPDLIKAGIITKRGAMIHRLRFGNREGSFVPWVKFYSDKKTEQSLHKKLR